MNTEGAPYLNRNEILDMIRYNLSVDIDVVDGELIVNCRLGGETISSDAIPLSSLTSIT